MGILKLLSFPFQIIWTILSSFFSLAFTVLGFITHSIWAVISFFITLIVAPVKGIFGLLMACILFFSPHPSIEASQISILDYSTANSYAVVANQNNNLANVNSETNPPSHSPIRQATSGSCGCPYDIDKAGRTCGGRSAYSRPGGSHPICYLDD